MRFTLIAFSAVWALLLLGYLLVNPIVQGLGAPEVPRLTSQSRY